MGPAQVLTDMDQEIKPEISVKPLVIQEDTNLKCTSNCEDTVFDMEPSLDQKPVEPLGMTQDMEVDIIESTGNSETRFGEGDSDPNATEYSSSFGDTASGAEDGLRLSDAEVDSRFCGDNELDSSFFDGFDSLFRMRKKKLTAHWRRYISPLMWRCKWIELRIKEFQSKSLKYDAELAAYDKRKQLEFGQFSSDCGVRTLPFSRQSLRKMPMKRRKRKRIEDTDDITSYMSYHNLFSYYENKRSDADGASMDEECGHQVIAADVNKNDEFDDDHEWSALEFRYEDNVIEQVLWKIETEQTRVRKLKTQIDKLLTINAGKFSSMENLSILVQSDLLTSSARSPTLSPGNGDNMPIGALYTPPRNISDYDIGDMVLPESAVSSYGEATPLPDIIESTVRLSAAEVPLDQPQIGDSCKTIVDDVLIHNEAVEKDVHNLENVGSLPMEKPQESLKEEQEKVITAPKLEPASEPDTTRETVPAQGQSVLKFCLTSDFHVPKNKRKRVERKAGSGSWNAEKLSTQILR